MFPVRLESAIDLYVDHLKAEKRHELACVCEREGERERKRKRENEIESAESLLQGQVVGIAGWGVPGRKTTTNRLCMANF